MKKIETLRKRYPKFVYEKYSYRISKKDLKISFNFEISNSEKCSQNIYFKPKIVIENIDRSRVIKIGDRVLNNLVFHLGLMEIPSYWKATCSPEILIKAGPINPEQIKWWRDLIIRGMGQFFYENKIDFLRPNFFKIISNVTREDLVTHTKKLRNRYLVPVGGGKDSVVTLEILSSFAKATEDKEKIQCFSLNPTEAAQKIMKIGGCKKPIIVKRTIDPKLLELNRQGFLNGHTPFSAYLAFLSVFCAVIFDKKYIALSNERSSNEGNLKYFGEIINHQWSKSFDFEKRFREYSEKYLAKDVEYFSFLRPLYEIQIAKLFSKYQKYFSAFLSCNEAYKTASGRHPPTALKKPTNPVQIASRLYGARKWCGSCPKCLFVFTALYPFIEESELLKIFGKNLFKDKKLLPTMQQLIGKRGFKPFECVGTKKESFIAFYLSLKKYIGPTYVNLPLLLKYFRDKILPKYPNLESGSKKLLKSWNNKNFLPEKFDKILFKIYF